MPGQNTTHSIAPFGPYSDNDPYSDGMVPKKVVKSWDEQCRKNLWPAVQRDYAHVRNNVVFEGKTPAKPAERKLYLATAGGPCAGKSTEMDFELTPIPMRTSHKDTRYDGIVTIDPDRYTMGYMSAYQNQLSAGRKAELCPMEAARQAYDLARPGSNSIANRNLNEAVAEGYHIAHGTTLTTPFAGALLTQLANKGYERRLLLCGASDDTRIEAGGKRRVVEGHYQVDPGDFVEKGKAFPERHGDYFAHGDHVVLLWKDQVEKPAVRAAEYTESGRTILDNHAFTAYTEEYAQKRDDISSTKSVLSWAQCERNFFSRFGIEHDEPI